VAGAQRSPAQHRFLVNGHDVTQGVRSGEHSSGTNYSATFNGGPIVGCAWCQK
jgi:hypothetical protein